MALFWPDKIGLMNLQTKSGKPLFPIGIGTWNVASRINPDNPGSAYRGVEPVHGHEQDEIAAIRYSLARGQNHIDLAELYGGFYTDEVVGRALEGSRREDLYVADKLWKTSVGPGLVRGTVTQMLDKLKTDYLDLLYIHAPWEDAPWREAIAQIDELIDEGTVRQFGVSNFNVVQMEEAMALSRHPIAANQVNFNVLHQDEADTSFRAFCRKHDVQIVAYQPIKRREVIDDATVKAVAEKHRVTPAQVALSWLIKMGTLPIPKAMTKAHIDENLAAATIELTDEDMSKLTR